MSMGLEFYINNPWYGPPWCGFLLIFFVLLVFILGLGFVEKKIVDFFRVRRKRKEEEIDE